jgi:integrase
MAAEGIELHHLKGCPAGQPKAAGRGRCNCKPRYRAFVYNPRSKKRETSKWGPSEAEARKWRAEAQEQLENGTSRPRGNVPMIGEIWDEWLAEAKAGDIGSKGGDYRASTLAGYERVWETKLGEFSSRKVTDLTHLELQEWIKQQTGKRSTKAHLLDPLHVVYKRALKYGHAAVNPTIGIELPGQKKEDVRFASREEAAELLRALRESDRAVWATAFYAGLRTSELRALRCSDIDLEAGVLKVERAWPDEEPKPSRPKSAASKRRVGIAPALADILKAHLEATGYRDNDLLFGRGGELTPFLRQSLSERAQRDWKAAKPKPLEPITRQNCRHTCASFMIASGANAKALSVVMGHESITITFDRYGHLMPGGEADVGRLLGEYLRPAA